MQSNVAHKNIIEFPRRETLMDSLKRRTQGKPCEVFALRRLEDIQAMQQYFLKKKQYRNFLYVIIGVSTGLRGSDIVKLKWNDILYSTGEFKPPEEAWVQERKTGKFRYLVFNDDVKKAVKFYLEKTGIRPNYLDDTDPDYYVFKKTRHNAHYDDVPYISRKSMGDIIKRASLHLRIPYNVNTHSLRKTFGYRFYKKTNDIVMLQHILNHSSPETTLRYIGILAEDEAAAIQSMDSIIAFMSDEKD